MSASPCRYKGLSLSRKAFRFLRSVADLITASTHAATIGTQGAAGALGAVQWMLMAAHIFWDNMFFATHPIVVRCRSQSSCMAARLHLSILRPAVPCFHASSCTGPGRTAGVNPELETPQ